MPITLEHPYAAAAGPWLKGNLHTHTTESDGPQAPQDTIADYARLGYDFLMISDHDVLTDPALFDSCGMMLIPGNEITADAPHLLHVGAQSVIAPLPERQAVIDAINAEGGFAIVNHPNWEKHYNHCDQALMMQWQDYAGIEIYNGVTRRVEGSPLATDRWDRLLSAGRRVWGYATDDPHRVTDYGVAWTTVCAARRDAAAIVDALRTGCFYSSTGVEISAIRVDGPEITVETKNAQQMHVCTAYSRTPEIVEGPALRWSVPEDFRFDYVRVECLGPGGAMAWTQPFFVKRG